MGDKKVDEADPQNDLDYVLSDVGEFGKYQIFQCILMILPIILSATYAVEFIVTSSTDDYRCSIPECELMNSTVYDQKWLSHAIPFKNGRPEKCSRYVAVSHEPAIDGQCPKTLFNESNVIGCTEFIFRSNEYRIMREFDILCDENEYKLALVGTINNIGGFLFMPSSGLLSDKFGRLTVLICGMVSCAMFGLIKAFVGSYMWYMVLEFLCAAVGTTTYMAAFVLCVEWVSSKYRILASTLIAATYPGGEVLLGVMAILLPNYRQFLVTIYIPALFVALYFWIVPESVRWLIATGKYDRALKILKRTAKQNNRQISEKSLEILRSTCNNANGNENGKNNCTSVTAIFQNKILFVRLIMCSMCWIMTVFVFYGLSVNATKIADDSNKYLSYITTMIAEVPAALITYFLLKYIGRRTAMCCALTTAGSATILSTLVPSHYTLIIRIMFFVGMCATSSAFAVLYVFSAEIWPTGIRNTAMNLQSMVGRCGSMLAPLAILLSHYMQHLPLLLFGSAAILSGFIIFMLPETKGKKLPHSVRDAIEL